MTSLTTLVEVPEKVASTKSKKEKISLLAHLLLQTKGEEITLVASYLSGQLPQGQLVIGWATLQKALQDLHDQTRSLNLIEVDSFFERISKEKGTGSLSGKEVANKHESIKHKDYFLMTTQRPPSVVNSHFSSRWLART
jgi:hypothetical protein